MQEVKSKSPIKLGQLATFITSKVLFSNPNFNSVKYGFLYELATFPIIYSVKLSILEASKEPRYLLSKGKVEEAQKIVDDLEMRLGVKYKGDLKVTTDDTPTEKPKLKDEFQKFITQLAIIKFLRGDK